MHQPEGALYPDPEDRLEGVALPGGRGAILAWPFAHQACEECVEDLSKVHSTPRMSEGVALGWGARRPGWRGRIAHQQPLDPMAGLTVQPDPCG